VPEPSGLYLPNRIARAFFIAMDDVMGQHGLGQLLTLAHLERWIDHFPPDDLQRDFDFADLAALSEGLELMYGERGGRGMALRIGRASFAKGLKRFGIMRGVADKAFRAQPLPTRLNYGLLALQSIYNNFSDQHTSFTASDSHYTVQIENSPMAWARHADRPLCHAQVGILQECLRWASDGFEFHVQEVSCHACGDELCTFQIKKKAIGERTI